MSQGHAQPFAPHELRETDLRTAPHSLMHTRGVTRDYGRNAESQDMQRCQTSLAVVVAVVVCAGTNIQLIIAFLLKLLIKQIHRSTSITKTADVVINEENDCGLDLCQYFIIRFHMSVGSSDSLVVEARVDTAIMISISICIHI